MATVLVLVPVLLFLLALRAIRRSQGQKIPRGLGSTNSRMMRTAARYAASSRRR